MQSRIPHTLVLALLVALGLGSLLSHGRPAPAQGSVLAAPPPGFAYRCGIHFCLDGQPYYFAGTNVYDFFTFGDGSSAATQADIENRFMDKARIDAHMARLQAAGVSVVRLWMFSHETWHGFEPSKGVYNEAQFMLFDYVIESARAHNIKLLPVFENYWEAYGGIDTRLRWEGLTGGHPGRAIFFDKTRCPGCFTSYKNYVSYALNRVNHYSGVAYKNEPTIFAWELMNEPRYQGVSPAEDVNGTTLRAWVDEMGAHIKAIDPNHMLGAGLEAHESRYGFGGNEGNPFIYIHQSPYIDFTSAHPYPTEEWAHLSIDQTKALIHAWISDSHDVVGKPFFMGEFNSHTGVRTDWWRAFFSQIEVDGGDGSAFWWYQDHAVDTKFGVSAGAPELAVFTQHSNAMKAKSGPFPTPTITPTTDPTRLLKVQYLTSNTGSSANQITAYLNIVNTGAGLQYIPLSALKVRYWFTTDTSVADQYGCLYAIVGCSNLSATIVQMTTPRTGADRYLEIGFSSAAGTLAPFASTGDIQNRINKSDWSSYNQGNDYSFDGTKTAYADWNRVTLYYNGALVWGVEPGGTVPTNTPINTPTRTPTNTPTRTPTAGPSNTPTRTPTAGPSNTPTRTPTAGPSNTPTRTPTRTPTGAPTNTVAPTNTPTPGSSSLKVQYRAADTTAGDNQIKPHFTVVNTGSSSVPLSELRIRYWYTIDGDKAQTFSCDHAVRGCANVSGTFVKLTTARPGADYYVEISFGAGAGSLAAGANSGEIQTRLNKTDWTNYNETGDYSFDPTKTNFADWTRVTLYRNGTLVWGTEP